MTVLRLLMLTMFATSLLAGCFTAAGYEAKILAEGSLELHAHPGDVLTLWAFTEQGESRHYSKPVLLKLPTR